MDLNTFFKVGYGMYIISSKLGDKYNGQIANAVMQVSSDPPLFTAGMNNNNLTCKYIKDNGYFSVSILSEESDMKFIGKFGFKSGKNIDKFLDTEYIISDTKIPVITENTVAYFVCKLINIVDVGTHSVFIGEAVEAKILNDKTPLTYKYYREVLRGKSPKTAPTFIKTNKQVNEIKQKESKMSKYECTVCGYVYDPAEGDPENGIKAGTAFEDLPDDWVCPECGVGKEDFEKLED